MMVYRYGLLTFDKIVFCWTMEKPEVWKHYITQRCFILPKGTL